MIDIYREFSIITKALEDNKIEYALCGGFAVSLHGFVRATEDIDFVILANGLQEIRSILKKLGFITESEPMIFSEGKITIFRFTKIEIQSGDYISVDLLILDSSLSSIWNQIESFPFENGKIKVLSRQALIELKLLRNSLQDRQDIEKLRGYHDEN